ncbi:MAG: polysaccharide biosynthesis/export family protein [Pseudomonadales bacterium]|jgi:polysaccharide export outer membrane protein|nr:polysaccharide biosynthesis/export family protein [Pseudomonadales bacterium]MCP5336316.1 polysaccharide biosynthesis/export family protein [Pseudomonadales bacterium]
MLDTTLPERGSQVIDLQGVIRRIGVFAGVTSLVFALAGCGSTPDQDEAVASPTATPDYEYLIGPGDTMEIFVWGNPDLSTSVAVKPDGKITTRLVENIDASGKTASQLARDIERAYGEYVKSAVVSVILTGFQGVPYQQVRIVGQAAKPLSIPYRKHMTVLDAMIDVGGLTEFAAGNRAVLVRNFQGNRQTIGLRLDDLLKDGNINANIGMYPGDIIIVPEAWF